jgi:hypothetical protein
MPRGTRYAGLKARILRGFFADAEISAAILHPEAPFCVVGKAQKDNKYTLLISTYRGRFYMFFSLMLS